MTATQLEIETKEQKIMEPQSNTQKRMRIYTAWNENEGKKGNVALAKEFEEFLTSDFGGCTCYNHFGCWENRYFEKITEEGFTFEVLFEVYPDNLNSYYYGEMCKSLFNQECVIVTIEENIQTFLI